MRVRIPFISPSAVRNRQKPDESYPLNFAETSEAYARLAYLNDVRSRARQARPGGT